VDQGPGRACWDRQEGRERLPSPVPNCKADPCSLWKTQVPRVSSPTLNCLWGAARGEQWDCREEKCREKRMQRERRPVLGSLGWCVGCLGWLDGLPAKLCEAWDYTCYAVNGRPGFQGRMHHVCKYEVRCSKHLMYHVQF
jgi:hypothetical protein